MSISEPARVAALALSRDGNRELLVANLTGDAVNVHLDGWDTDLRVRHPRFKLVGDRRFGALRVECRAARLARRALAA